MQITLKQSEIESALKFYIESQGIKLDGKVIEITFISGRKNNGLSAEVSIENDKGSSVKAVELPIVTKVFLGYPVEVTTVEHITEPTESDQPIQLGPREYVEPAEDADLDQVGTIGDTTPVLSANIFEPKEDDTPPIEVAPKQKVVSLFA